VTTPRPPRLSAFWETVGRPGALYLFAEAMGKGATYLVFIWLATQMTVEDFGFLNVFISLLTLLGVVVGLGLPDGVVRFHFRREGFAPALTFAFIMPVGMTVLIASLLLPFRGTVALLLNVPVWLAVAALLGAAPVALRQAWLGVLRARREAGHFLVMRVLEPIGFLASLAGLLWLGKSLGYQGTAGAYLVAIGVVALVGVVAAVSRFRLQINLKVLRPLTRYSLPLVAHSFAMTGLALFDQLVLQQIVGPEGAGVYAFAYRFGMAMSLFALAFSHVWGPLAMDRMSDGRPESLVPLAKNSLWGLLGIALLLAWTLPAIAGRLGGLQYSASIPLIPAVVYAYLWMALYTLMATTLAFRERSGTLAVASGTAFLLNALLNYLTIPIWGPAAAAATTVISYMFLALLVWVVAGDRSLMPWGRLALQMALAAPLVLLPTLLF